MNRSSWITTLLLIALLGSFGINLIGPNSDETPDTATPEQAESAASTEEPPSITFVKSESPLSYDYDDLLSGELIQVPILNESKKPITITAGIEWEPSLYKNDNHITFTHNISPTKGLGVTYLKFKLLKSETTPDPKTGKYNGFLVLKDEDGSKVIQKALTLAVPDAERASSTTYWEAIVASWQRLPKWLLGGVKNLPFFEVSRLSRLKLGRLEFLFLISVIVFLLQRWKRWSQRGKLGPVTIDKILKVTQDNNNERKDYSALIQEILANTGLLPHSDKPTPTMSTQLGVLIKESVPTGGNIIDSLIKLVHSALYPKDGYTVTGTLWDGDEKSTCKLTLNIKNERTGQHEIKAMVASDDYDVSENSAYFIYCHLMGDEHIRSRIPKWTRFSNPDAFEHYQRGKKLEKLEKKQDKREALKEYQQASALEPNNVLIDLQMANVLEDLGQYLKALEILLKVVSRWPDLLEARYRLGAVLSFADKLLEEWYEQDNAEQKKELKELLDFLLNDDVSNKNSTFASINDQSYLLRIITQECLVRNDISLLFIKLADYQWEYLQKELCWCRRVCKYLGTFWPLNWRPDERTYFRKWIALFPWGSNRRQFKRRVDMARFCQMVQYLDSHSKKREERVRQLKEQVDSIVKPRFCNLWDHWEWYGVDWGVRYNAACFYALAMSKPPDEDEYKNQDKDKYEQDKEEWEGKDNNQTFAEAAVKQLDRVLRDPEGISILPWMDKDPDLESLRKHSYYQNWLDLMGVPKEKKEKKMSKTNKTQLNTLCHACQILAAGAADQVEQWQEHVKKIKLWREVDAYNLTEWCQHEHHLWNALLFWAEHPKDESYRERFWQLVAKKNTEQPKEQKEMCHENDPQKMDKTLSKYNDFWGAVAIGAKCLADCWDQREDQSRERLYTPKKNLDVFEVSKWAEEAVETWLALENWAKYPKDKAQKRFEEKSSCSTKEPDN